MKIVDYVGKLNEVVDWYMFRYGEGETEFDNISTSFFLPAEEIVTDLVGRLPNEDIELLKDMKEQDLISLHSSFGMMIRNMYGLWHPNNPYINTRTSDFHPDQYSFYIITQLHKKLNNNNAVEAYEEAMKVLK